MFGGGGGGGYFVENFDLSQLAIIKAGHSRRVVSAAGVHTKKLGIPYQLRHAYLSIYHIY